MTFDTFIYFISCKFFFLKNIRWWNDEQRRKGDQRSNNIMKDHINKENK
jgi:hypothetical protein